MGAHSCAASRAAMAASGGASAAGVAVGIATEGVVAATAREEHEDEEMVAYPAASTDCLISGAATPSGTQALADTTAEDGEEEERFQQSLNTFFFEFHRHIFNPVLFRLTALATREEPPSAPRRP